HIAGWIRDRVAAVRDGIISISHAGQAALQLAFLVAIGPDEYLFRLTSASQRSDDEVLRQRFSLTQSSTSDSRWVS
ncbi:DNA-binding response regulator, partial [Rhizobium leguminosarum]